MDYRGTNHGYFVLDLEKIAESNPITVKGYKKLRPLLSKKIGLRKNDLCVLLTASLASTVPKRD